MSDHGCKAIGCKTGELCGMGVKGDPANTLLKREEAGLCLRCGEPVYEDRLYCELCRGFEHEQEEKEE